jgi:endothelin-converting enzyme/putative endopeptidase
MSRSLFIALCGLFAAGAQAADTQGVLAPTAAQHGVQLSDIDKGAQPCDDFFEYANGQWRKDNPIPASLPRWSRRWQAGESSKDRLKIILEETAAIRNAPAGSGQQLTGDFYGACMDEARLDKLGVEPLRPKLAEIQALGNIADVQRMIASLHEIGLRVPFVLIGLSDNHEPNDVIAHVLAGGLGMPDRDYYLSTEARFKEAREKYLVHVTNTFRLSGLADAQAKAAADTVMRFETALAKASLDNVALRDPQKTDHKTSFAELQKLTPHFDWVAFYSRAKLPQGDLNVWEPDFLREVDRQLTATPLAWRKPTSCWVRRSGANTSRAISRRRPRRACRSW